MPPRLPDRYRLNVRLGADGDVEEWLATDTHLERPVLVRFPGPAGSNKRMAQFLASVRAAAATSHPHVQRVFAAGELNGSAFAVSEWDGAVTVADRLRAGETLPINEYLPNAAGLAEGLAAFHASGGIHGSIDTASIHFSAAHPARLAGFGRQPRTVTQGDDTIALANVLRTAITGSDNPWVQPSQVAEGLPGAVDDVLNGAASGTLGAADLASALRALPYSPPREPSQTWSWSGLVLFAGIAAAILGFAALGLAIDIDPDSPFLYPAAPADHPPGAPATTIAVVDDPVGEAVAVTAVAFDPLGDGGENDADAPAAVDGDDSTSWRTELYAGPLSDTKAGVGLVLTPAGPISTFEISGSPGTAYTIAWAAEALPSPNDWEPIGTGTLLTGRTRHQVRTGQGVWLLWLTQLPEVPGEGYAAEISDIVLTP